MIKRYPIGTFLYMETWVRDAPGGTKQFVEVVSDDIFKKNMCLKGDSTHVPSDSRFCYRVINTGECGYISNYTDRSAIEMKKWEMIQYKIENNL